MWGSKYVQQDNRTKPQPIGTLLTQVLFSVTGVGTYNGTIELNRNQ